MPSSMAVFFPFLEQELPDLVDRYRRDFERTAYLPKTYAAALREVIKGLRAKHGFEVGGARARRSKVIHGPQLSLFS